MTFSLHTSRPDSSSPEPGRDRADWGVLLWSGLVCPAASEAVAREQAARLGGVECQTGEVPQ